MKISKPFFVLICIVCITNIGISQGCPTCTGVVTYDVDLSANPDTVWISEQIGRSGQCCHGTGSEVCIRFNIITHKDADLLGFTLAEPPIPPSMQYSLNCGIPQSVDIPMCLETSEFCIVYCKPGGDLLRYKISTSRAGYASPDVVVGDGCEKTIWAAGYIESSIRWNVVYPNSTYNSYLSCLNGCYETTITAQAGFPPYMDVEVTGDIQGACVSASQSKDTVRVYFVNDKLVTIEPDNPTICYGGVGVSISANASGGAVPYEYLWSTGETTQSIFVSSAGTYTVTVTDSTDCPPISDDVSVFEHSSAITVDAGNANVCTSSPQVLLNGSVQVASGGEWSGGAGTFSPGNTTLNALYTLSATEIANLGATLTLTSTGNGGCPPANDQLQITVSPEPIVDAGVNGKVCQNTLAINLNGQIIGQNDGGTWATLGSGTFSNASILNPTYYPSQADTALGYVRLILSSNANGICQPIRDTVTIEFGNAPQVAFDFSQPACAGEPINFTDRTTVSWGVVQTWEWDFNGAGSSTLRNPTYSFSTPGTYSVTLRTVTNEGCDAEITRQVQVATDPVADFTYTKECFGNGVTFQNTSVDGIAWNWTFNNGFVSTVESPSGIIYSNDGFFDVKLIATNANGCKDTVTHQIEVLPRPIADFQVDNICQGDNVTFNDNSTIVNDVITSWFWDFGDGTTSTDQNPVQSFSTSNPLNVKLVVSTNSCTDYIVRQVTPLQKPSFFASPISGCSPLVVNFYNTVQPNVFYNWDFGDGQTAATANPTHMFYNTTSTPSTFEVTLHARSIFGCQDSAKANVLVNPKSVSAFSVSSTGVCSGQTINFTNESQDAVSYLWDFGSFGLGVDENPSMVFTNETASNVFIPVKLITSSQYNCFDTIIQYMSIYPIPDNQISLNTTEACHPAVISLTAQPGAQTYTWNYGDGVIEVGSNNMSHTFINESSQDKTFDIVLEVSSSNNCKNTAQATVLVHNSPIAEFSLNKSLGCSPLDIQIYNTSQSVFTYNWDYGDGTSNTTSSMLHSHTYTNMEPTQKSYEIILDVTSLNGCTSTFNESVSVFPQIKANFTMSVNSGCSPLIVDFVNTSEGANSFRWNFGDGDFSTNKNARHTFLNETTNPVTSSILLVATSSLGCVDSAEIQQVIINPRPSADFAISTTSGCSPFEVPITNNTTGASILHWYMSNGFYSFTDLSSYIFNNSSNVVEKHIMTLVANNQYNCPDTSFQSVTIYPEVQAYFSPQTSGCSPLTVQFANSSTNAYSFSWNFGDGNESSISNPENTFVNETETTVTFDVALKAVSDFGCESNMTLPIEVYPVPNPDFQPNPNYLQYPETTVSITNTTPGSWIFNWTFGDGTSLYNVKNPLSHTFPGVGEYQIVLSAESYLCKDTISHTVVIRGAEIIADYDTSYVGCSPVEATFTNKSINATWYLWDFGDGETSSLINPTHIYEFPGTYIVELRAGNGSNEAVSRKHSVVVHPNPTADFSVAPEVIYLPNAIVSFYNQSDLANQFVWYFGDGERDTVFETSHQYTEPGLYDVALSVETENECWDSIMKINAIEVKLECQMIFPNAFTPRETEISGAYNPEIPETTNDIFHPVYENIYEYNLQIFNRWGELIFESNDINIGWNGYYNNILCKQDTYVWQVEATCLGGSKKFDSGSVTLLR